MCIICFKEHFVVCNVLQTKAIENVRYVHDVL